MSAVFPVSTICTADRGFRYGDGVFETMRLAGGRVYRLEAHVARLRQGLAALRIPEPAVEWATLLHTAAAHEGATDAILRLAVSRGVDAPGGGGQGYLPAHACTPTIAVDVLPLPAPPAGPLRLWLSDWRRASPRSLPTHAKLAQGITSTLARMEARDHAADEALLLSETDQIAEAAAANIFWLHGNVLYTPGLGTGALAGTTRGWVLTQAPLLGLDVREGSYPLSTLSDADAVFLTNTAMGIQPVGTLDPMGWQWPDTRLANTLQARREGELRKGAV